MTRIYEALELASKRRSGQAEAPEVPVPPAQAPPKIDLDTTPDTPLPFDVRLEQTLTALYNTIASQIPGPKGRTVEFVAPHRGAGSSTLIRELAKVAAVKLKKSVLLLDADRHQPTQIEEFHITEPAGWDTILKDGKKIESALYPVGGSGLSVSQLITNQASGPLLFDSPQFRNMLNRLKENFDLILVDAPPAADYAEGITLASKVDGVVMVVEAEKTRWQVLESMQNRIQLAGGHVLGAVLNKRHHHIPESIYKRL